MMKLNLNLIWLLFLVFQVNARQWDIYLKDLIDNSDLIVVAKVTSLTAKSVRYDKATAKVIKVIKGDSIPSFPFRPYPLDHDDNSDAKMGETAILLLKKKSNNNFEIAQSGRGRIPSITIKQQRFGILLYGVTYPFRIIKQIVNQKMEDAYPYTLKFVQFDSITQVIADLVNAPPLIKGQYLIFPRFLTPPFHYMIDDYLKHDSNATDVDKIAIFDGIFNPGVRGNVFQFIFSDAPKISKNIADKTEDWKFPYFNNTVFRMKNDKLIEVNDNSNKSRAYKTK